MNIMHNKPPGNQKKGIIKKIKEKIRYNMVLQVIKNRFTAIGFEFTPYYIFRESMNNIGSINIHGNISDYKVEFLEEAEIKTINTGYPGYTVEKFLEHLSFGRKCIGVKYKDEIVAFTWFDFKECNFKPNKFKMKDNEVYSFSLFTMEPYRGKNIAPWLKIRSYEILKEMGIDTCYSIIEVFNSTSLRYCRKLKFKKVKLGLKINIFKRYEYNITLKTYK